MLHIMFIVGILFCFSLSFHYVKKCLLSSKHLQEFLKKFLSNAYYVSSTFLTNKKIPCIFLCKGRIIVVPPMFPSYYKCLNIYVYIYCIIKTAHFGRNVSFYVFAYQKYHIINTRPIHLQQSSSGGKFDTIFELRRLSAGDLHSLIENIALLCTFYAFFFIYLLS